MWDHVFRWSFTRTKPLTRLPCSSTSSQAADSSIATANPSGQATGPPTDKAITGEPPRSPAESPLDPDNHLPASALVTASSSISPESMDPSNDPDQEAREILAPIVRQLERLKETKTESQPPPNPYIKIMSHDERIRKLLLPIGKVILQKIRGRRDHGMIEMRLCKFIARNYWPFPREEYTHLRIHEIYRNSIFLENQAKKGALEALERARERNENKLRGGSSASSDAEESQAMPPLEEQDRLTEPPRHEDREIPKHTTITDSTPIPFEKQDRLTAIPRRENRKPHKPAPMPVTRKVVELLREFGYKGPTPIPRRHPVEVEMEHETDTRYELMRSHRQRRPRKVYKASGRRMVNLDEEDQSAGRRLMNYGEEDETADLAIRPEVDNSSALHTDTSAPTNGVELTEEEFDAATAEAIRLSLQDMGHQMGPSELPRLRESVLTVPPGVEGDNTESDGIREIHLDGTCERPGDPEDRMGIDFETKTKESRPRDESGPPPASPPKRRKISSSKSSSWTH